MAQREIELVLMRQLASYLAQPILILDANGDLLFFNEPAEAIVGKRFDEIVEIRRGEWRALFKPSDNQGASIKREDLPLTIAIDKRQPAHLRYWIQGLDGVRRKVESTAFPLVGQAGRNLGAVGIFWEIDRT
jgi:PAS domain-containing protein